MHKMQSGLSRGSLMANGKGKTAIVKKITKAIFRIVS